MSPYVENEITINASQTAVWQAFSDHANMGTWSIFNSRLIKVGADHGNGVGAVRELTLLGSKIVEEVLAYEPEKYFSYTLRKVAPFSSHLGQIYLTQTDTGVKVRWVIRFSSKILGSGKITALILKKVFSRDLRKLKRQLEMSNRD